MTTAEPKSITKEICHEMDLPVIILKKAEELINESYDENLIAGKSPKGIAAGAVYAAALLTNEKNPQDITQESIAEAAGVSTVTIRNRYKDHLRAIGVEPPPKQEMIDRWTQNAGEE